MHVSSDGGATWVQVAHISNFDGWVLHEVHLADYIPLTAGFQVRFTAIDLPNNSRTEAAVDAVKVFDVSCE